MKHYRVGIIGFAHMHVNSLAADFNRHPQVEWAACADTIPLWPEIREAPYTRGWNLKQVRETCGIPREYADYREMLKQENLDIVIVTSENARHGEVAEACASAGAHVVVEKPMAASLGEALRMTRACQAAGTKLVVNWPSTWSPLVRTVKRLVEESAVGRILEVKWRSGHTGPLGPRAVHPGVEEEAAPMTGPERGATWWHQSATGGGALLDYCCYGALLARWYLNEPASAALGLKANLDSLWGDAEDNAAVVVRFPSAMAVLEGSWTQLDYGVPGGPILYGTHGTIVVDGHESRIRVERGHGQTEWITAEPLPAGREDIASEMIHFLETGEPLHETLEPALNLEAMAILDAGIRSADSGKLEMVQTPTWEIGH